MKSSPTSLIYLVWRVSALAAEWIEIPLKAESTGYDEVSALAAEWIEICSYDPELFRKVSLRPRGGVD